MTRRENTPRALGSCALVTHGHGGSTVERWRRIERREREAITAHRTVDGEYTVCRREGSILLATGMYTCYGVPHDIVYEPSMVHVYVVQCKGLPITIGLRLLHTSELVPRSAAPRPPARPRCKLRRVNTALRPPENAVRV